MLFFSNSKVWIPLYLLLIILIFRKNKNNKPLAFKYIFIILLALGFSDYIASGIFKPYFQRLRPCQDILNQMILVGKCGGKFGFASSHAANSFALFFMIFKIFGRANYLSILMLIWAIIVSYSRIYLGVHYPGDVLVGSLLGILISYSIFELFKPKTI